MNAIATKAVEEKELADKKEKDRKIKEAKFLPDYVLTVIFASSADVNSINNSGRTTCYNSVFITDNLLCFDECHGTTS